MDKDRLMHSYKVALKMQEIGKKLQLDDNQINELFILGLNHDIGYHFTSDHHIHNKVGGEILKQSNYKYWQEVYYHGDIQSEYQSLYLDILNLSDMQIDKYGNDIGFTGRLIDIKNRYTEESNVYQKCKKLIKNLQQKYPKI